jgi:hypothetical protein
MQGEHKIERVVLQDVLHLLTLNYVRCSTMGCV